MFKINKKLLYTPLSITIGLYAKTHANVFNDDVAQIGSDTKQNVTNILQNEFLKHLKEDQIVTHVEERKNRGKAWNTYHTSNHYPNFILYPKK